MLHVRQQGNPCLDLSTLCQIRPFQLMPIFLLFLPQQQFSPLAQPPSPRLLTSLQSSAKLPPKRQSFLPLLSRPPISELRHLLKLIVELLPIQQFSRLMLALTAFFKPTLLHRFTKLADLIVAIHSAFLQSQLELPLLFVKPLAKQQPFLFNAALVQLVK